MQLQGGFRFDQLSFDPTRREEMGVTVLHSEAQIFDWNGDLKETGPTWRGGTTMGHGADNGVHGAPRIPTQKRDSSAPLTIGEPWSEDAGFDPIAKVIVRINPAIIERHAVLEPIRYCRHGLCSLRDTAIITQIEQARPLPRPCHSSARCRCCLQAQRGVELGDRIPGIHWCVVVDPAHLW